MPFATQEPANQLRKVRVTGSMRHAERRNDLDTGTFEITVLEHHDIA